MPIMGVSSLLLVMLLLSPFTEAGAYPCNPDIQSPQDRAVNVSLTPRIKVGIETIGDCKLNHVDLMKVEIWEAVINNGKVYEGKRVYDTTKDLTPKGLLKGRLITSDTVYEKLIPEGKLEQNATYRLKVEYEAKGLQIGKFDKYVPHLDSIVFSTGGGEFVTRKQAQKDGATQVDDNAVIARTVTREQGINRPGQDYRSFDLDDADPLICARQCAEEASCVAYTYVPPGMQGKKARCWLKDAVPGKQSKQGLVSGVKTRVRVPMNANLNLPGNDYDDFDLQAAEPSRCASACAKDPRCEAYTYVKPGVQGNNARCWLKNAIPNRVQGQCCVSGVKETIR